MPVLAYEGTVVRAEEVKEYCDEYFFSCLDKWILTKMWGLAHGKGWAEEPLEYISVISILESEQNKMEKEEMDRKTASIGTGSS